MIDITNNIMNGINVMITLTLYLGGAHEFTAIDDLKSSLTQELDKLRVEAQQRESEADKLVKDTMIALQNWDRKTEELVSQLQKTRDEHVSTQANDKTNGSNNKMAFINCD